MSRSTLLPATSRSTTSNTITNGVTAVPPDPDVHTGVCTWVQYGDKLLMLLRGGTEGYAADGNGTWSLPGGWLEAEETLEAAAAREVLEETGVTVRITDRIGYTCDPKHTKHSVVTLFLRGEYVAGEPTVTEPDKCPQVEWVPLDEVLERQRPLFQPLAAYLDGQGQRRSDLPF